MEVALALAAAAMVAVAGAATIWPRFRVPAPLLLVVLGVVVCLLPFVPDVSVPPQVVLVGVLPPLLYSASASLPVMDLRRELSAVSGLSVVLVLITALVLGWVFTLLIPGLDYRWGVALGAVISPTDAVATSIVKRMSVSRRVISILEGESLLNDATALVLLRAAIAGTAGVSAIGVFGDFLYAVVVAIVIGVVAARLILRLRTRVSDPAVGTVLSFTVPFIASVPAEVLDASGLVAAVTAGLVVSRRAGRVLPPQQRLSDEQTWGAVSLILEGVVFLLMGLQIRSILTAAAGGGDPAAAALSALALGAIALAVVLVVRTVFVTPLLVWLHRRARHGQAMRGRLVELQQAVEANDLSAFPWVQRRARRRFDPQRLTKRLRLLLGDIDYLAASPLGLREGAVVVWAGMRGTITVAAAQTIPLPGAEGGPAERSELVLIAFAVAALSLLLQGGTLAGVIRLLKPKGDDPAALADEHARVLDMLKKAAEELPEVEGESRKRRRLRQLDAQRDVLLTARDDGVFDSDILGSALATVDAAQVAIDLTGGPDG